MFAQKVREQTVLPPRIDAVFHAATPELALALAKRALGADALVLATNTFMGPEGQRVELIASNAPGVGLPSLVSLAPRMPSLPVEPAAARAVSGLERLLRQHDVPNQLARELVLRIGDPHVSRPELLEASLRLTRSVIGFGDGARAGHRVIALVGPTGVGKTTTIAKLAARDALIDRKRVALVSLDDFRIGGAEQLQRYADLIEAPFAAARDEAQLQHALLSFRGYDRIYVDTAGRSGRERLPRTCEKLTELCPGIGIGLALAAGTRSAELSRALELHREPRASFLVLTKLDEAALIGAAFVATQHTRLPIAWITNGQRVPEDVEAARAEHVASLLASEMTP
jgi:flagellar biosynthesis protein FlhF